MVIEEFAMPRWDEASVDEMVADPIVRALMAADRVNPNQLKRLMRSVQHAIERRVTAASLPHRAMCVAANLFGREPQCTARS
jgi:hypothetical protein